MTELEKAELVKCIKDPMYLIKNYCKIKVDDGYAPINLGKENNTLNIDTTYGNKETKSGIDRPRTRS